MKRQKQLEFKRFWERQAKKASEAEVVFGKGQRAKWSRALDTTTFGQLKTFLGIRSGHTLLDIGCGPLARAEVQLSSEGFETVGLDVARTTLKKAKESVRKHGKARNVGFVLGDAEFLPFKENGFDVTLCIGAISHLPTVKSVITAIREMKRVIRPHGIIYTTFWLNLYSFSGIQYALMLRAADISRVDRAQFLTFRGLEEIHNILKCVGLKIRKIRYGNLVEFPYVSHFSRGFLTRILNKIKDVFNESHKTHSLFSRFSTVFEVTCEKVSPLHFESMKPDAYYQFF